MDKAGLDTRPLHRTPDAAESTTRSEARKPAESERRSGLLASLKEQFGKLQSNLDTGKSNSRRSLRFSVGSFDTITANIRRASLSLQPRATARSAPMTVTEASGASPAGEKMRKMGTHARLSTAIKNAPDSPLKHLDKQQVKLLMSALDTMTGLSDNDTPARESLLLLSDCIDGVLEPKYPSTPTKNDVPLSDRVRQELKDLQTECNKLINVLSEQTEPGLAPETLTAPSAALPDDLDQLEKKFTEAYGAPQDLIHTPANGEAIPEMDDLLDMMKELEAESSKMTGSVTHEGVAKSTISLMQNTPDANPSNSEKAASVSNEPVRTAKPLPALPGMPRPRSKALPTPPQRHADVSAKKL